LKKVILSIFLLAYLSGILTLVVGHILSLQSAPPEEETETIFIDKVNYLPWVKYAHRQQSAEELLYYRQITYLYSIDERIGANLLYANWLKDYIAEEEGRALSLLVVLSEKDSEIALSVCQSIWFLKGISSDEIALMEKILEFTQQDAHVVKNITSSTWFIVTGTHKADDVISTFMEMPPDLALAVSSVPWFKSDPSLSEFRAVQELITLYSIDENLAIRLSFMYEPLDFESLRLVSELYATDKELADTFFEYNTLSRESFLSLSDISQIAHIDEELAHSLVGELTQDKIQIISSLADVYAFDPELGKVASRTFGNNKTALRYLQHVLKSVPESESEPGFESELLERGAAFVSDNPEFVYEDRVEPYRYHLLTEILSELPAEKAQEYKNLIFVICSVYSNRFYSWQNTEYNTFNGWAYDKQLSDQEKDAVIELLNFFIEKNEQKALVVDLREVKNDYLYGLVDIPFTHFVYYDGTVVEAVHGEQGTAFVSAIIANIKTLRQRCEKVHQKLLQMNQVDYTYSNPLVDLIFEEGEDQDKIFLFFSAKNWETGPCVNHTLNTRMDSIVMGISTTTMHWVASESAHMYPAYQPSDTIAEKVQANPGMYGNPYVHKGFVAPYDKAGFGDYLDSDIEIVRIYDLQTEKEVSLLDRTKEGISPGKIVQIILVVFTVIVVGRGALKIVKRS